MSAITEAARAALQASRTSRQDEARATVLGLLGARVPAASVSVADTTDDLVVFTDGTVHLAVCEDGVHLVTGETGDWTHVDGPLEDLAALGKALA